MIKTKNDLSEPIRAKSVELLNARLADAIDLQTQTKQAHWNMDELAECAVQLGGVAEGTARMAAKRSSLVEYPAGAVDGHSHVEALSSALAAFGKSARKGIDDANEFGDLDTADLFTEISRGIDKWLWFVEAHLPERAAPASA
jgi:starvation-inducible DNA-binding protein